MQVQVILTMKKSYLVSILFYFIVIVILLLLLQSVWISRWFLKAFIKKKKPTEASE